MTLATKYLDIDEEAVMGPPVTMRKYAIPYSLGIVQEIAVADQIRRFMLLSRNSQLEAQSLRDVWQHEVYLPAKATTRTHPTLADHIVLFGGWKRWKSQSRIDHGVKEDAL